LQAKYRDLKSLTSKSLKSQNPRGFFMADDKAERGRAIDLALSQI